MAIYPSTASRRLHDRVDLTRQQVEAWLIVENGNGAKREYSACLLLNLSYAGMCLQGEDLFQTGQDYRFILDLSGVLDTEVEVRARVVWKKDMDAGLCYVGAVFTKSSAPWLGPEEDEGLEPAPPATDGE